MHVHELHAAAVHAPLVLLPSSAICDLVAVASRRPDLDRLGRRLWWWTVGAGAVAGLAGLAASQEVKANEPRTEDRIWAHGIGNFTILVGGIGIALYRTVRRPSLVQSLLGLAASGLAMYTAYLGGEIVYGHGAGVRAMAPGAPAGVKRSVPVLSAQAPGMLLRDAVQGLAWLFRRTARALLAPRTVEARALH
jgi:uncharacterized membrane protein